MRDYGTFGNYRRSDGSDKGMVIALLAIGLGIGAFVALLMAPKTGKQMRKTLKRKYEDARDVMGDWKDDAEDYMERGSEWASAAKDKVAPIARKLRRS
jgi:gas vesicle protein